MIQKRVPSSQDVSRLCIGISPLEARLASWISDLLCHRGRLQDLVRRYGSPLHLHFPTEMDRNADRLLAVAKDHDIDFQIYFARKANKCLAYVRRAQDMGFGIDTASLNELKQCVAMGATGDALVYTAAIKNAASMDYAMAIGATIVIDNEDELELLVSRLKQKGQHCSVKWALRLRGFPFADSRHQSRFGMPIDQAAPWLSDIRERHSSVAQRCLLSGLHFHLDGYDLDQRVRAIDQSIQLASSLRRQGFPIAFIDMGGGFPVCYLKYRQQWDAFWQSVQRQLVESAASHPCVIHRRGDIGKIAVGGQMITVKPVYPYWQELDAAAWLTRILEAPLAGHVSVCQSLIAAGLQLRCEPGRALMDQCGATIARVVFRKTDDHGELLVGLEMNRTNCMTTSADFCVDPMLIPAEGSTRTQPATGYFVGAYCMESEWITPRRMLFPQGVAIGDLVIFPNTAGYLMHFMESRSHQFDLPANLIAEDSCLDRWHLDRYTCSGLSGPATSG